MRMTHGEAIKRLKLISSLIGMSGTNRQHITPKEENLKDLYAIQMAIEALEKQIQKRPDYKCVSKNSLAVILEKQIQKRPDYKGDGYDENGNLIYDTWICPSCEEEYEVDYEEYKFCPNCGQRIDWSGEE